MVGRSSHAVSGSNGIGTGMPSRKGSTQVENGTISNGHASGKGDIKERTSPSHPTTSSMPADDGSDIDELVDSDSERAEMDQLLKSRAAAAASTAASGGGRGGKNGLGSRGRGRKASISAAGSSRPSSGRSQAVAHSSPPPPQQPESSKTRTELVAGQPSLVSKAPASSEKERTRIAPTDVAATTGNHTPRSLPSALPSNRPQHSPSNSGSSVMGAPPPYFYPAPGASARHASQSPQINRDVPLASTERLARGQITEDRLTSLEIDKFLDLIEKHNLHTSNEDDMARSVTELYQEWLEWCAKRNVKSTKSKQALVAEFVRVHQGEYGHTRQQRAMDIVKGSAGEPTGGAIDAPPAPLITPNSALLTASPRALAGPKLEDRERPVASSLSKRRVEGGPLKIGSTAPSPSVAFRSLTPNQGQAVLPLVDSYGITPAQMDSLHRNIRDDIWRDAMGMMQQFIRDHTADLIMENSSLRARVEQLEVHSDNLAQWIQHLNRVQEDLGQSLQPPANAPVYREEIMVDDPNVKYVHMNSHPPSRPPPGAIPVYERSYAPPYQHNGPPHSNPASPSRRNYTNRRSPSPFMTYRAGPPPPPSTAPRPNHGPAYQRASKSSRYREGAPEVGQYGAPHTHPSRIDQADSYDRPHYAYRPGDREPPPLPTSPPHPKRARNGY